MREWVHPLSPKKNYHMTVFIIVHSFTKNIRIYYLNFKGILNFKDYKCFILLIIYNTNYVIFTGGESMPFSKNKVIEKIKLLKRDNISFNIVYFRYSSYISIKELGTFWCVPALSSFLLLEYLYSLLYGLIHKTYL